MHRIEAYVRLALIFIVLITVLYLPVLFILGKRGKNILRQIGFLGLFCSIFLIVFATILFTPITFHPETYSLNMVPFAWIRNVDNYDQFIMEKVPNVLLFIPLGFFIPVVYKKMRYFYKTTLAAFSITFSIEFLQYFIGRSSDIDDIISNLTGAMIGYLFFRLFRTVSKRGSFRGD